MKILYHHRTMGRGAEGLHILHMTTAFEELGHEVILYSPPGVHPRREAGTGPLDMTRVKTRGIQSVWKAVSRRAPQILFEGLEILYNLWTLPRLILAHRRHRFDVIYERHAMFLQAGAWFSRLTGLPLLLEVNEISGPRRARGQALRGLAARMERAVFRRARGIFAVSSFLADRVAERIGRRDTVTVVPNAVDPNDFHRAFSGNRIREQYGVKDRIVIGCVGWFTEWDRLDFLLDAYRRLLTACSPPSPVLMLVGDGPVLLEIRSRVERFGLSDSVIFTGPVPRAEVLNVLDALDIAVIPHSNEYGSPMVLFEFMALRKPVAACGLMPLRDVVEDGVTGRLFEPLDAEALARTLTVLVREEGERKRLGEAAYRRVMENHTWSANARRVLDDYQRRNA